MSLTTIDSQIELDSNEFNIELKLTSKIDLPKYNLIIPSRSSPKLIIKTTPLPIPIPPPAPVPDEKLVINYDINDYLYMMFDGTSREPKDLKIGDKLMGDDSKPCEILDIIKVKEKSYLLTPIKGDEFIVGESDILSLSYSLNPNILLSENSYDFTYFNKNERREITKCFGFINYNSKEKAFEAATKYKNEIYSEIDINDNYFNISTGEFFTQPKFFKTISKIFRLGINFPHTEFEIDPYIIGMYLGDGGRASSNITSADPEIVDYFREYFEDFGLLVKSSGISHSITSGKRGNNYKGKNRYTEYLKEKGIFHHKNIPLEFLLTSRENRLGLLAGLLDSDGSLHNNCYDFIQKSKDIFDGFLFLSRSLGFSCYKSVSVKVCTNALNGPVHGEYFRCNLHGEGLDEIPTLLNRKQAHERKQIKRSYVSGFKLSEIGELEIYKIVTDNPKFLMNDFTVRHRYEILEPVKAKVLAEKIRTLPYGYKKRIEKDGDVIIFDEQEAIIIRFIFEENRLKISLNAIAKKLNDQDFKRRNNKIWTNNSLYHILENKGKYLGELRDGTNSYWPVIIDMSFDVIETKRRYGIYGYKKVNNNYEINIEEATTVRLIFEEYYEGILIKKTTEKLNSLGLKTSGGKNWNSSSYSNIIKNKKKYLEDIEKGGFPPILDSSYITRIKKIR